MLIKHIISYEVRLISEQNAFGLQNTLYNIPSLSSGSGDVFRFLPKQAWHEIDMEFSVMQITYSVDITYFVFFFFSYSF